MQAAPKHLVVITGPTAVGKTDFCIRLARRLGTEIISADSRQCYQELNIGTAKPTAHERAQVPHHLVDCRSIRAPYTAGAFAEDALQLLQSLWKRHSVVLLAGGSGLYIEALCKGLSAIPPVPPPILKQLQAVYQTQGLAPLVEALAIADPVYYTQCDLKNPHRVLRALSVCQSTNRPFSSFRHAPPTPRNFKTIKVGLQREQPILCNRINLRVDAMVAEGLFEEAKELYPLRSYPPLRTIGYQEAFTYLAGLCSKEEAIAAIKRHTRRYAKRQLTWLRRDKEISWYSPEEEATIEQMVLNRLAASP